MRKIESPWNGYKKEKGYKAAIIHDNGKIGSVYSIFNSRLWVPNLTKYFSCLPILFSS